MTGKNRLYPNAIVDTKFASLGEKRGQTNKLFSNFIMMMICSYLEKIDRTLEEKKPHVKKLKILFCIISLPVSKDLGCHKLCLSTALALHLLLAVTTNINLAKLFTNPIKGSPYKIQEGPFLMAR